MYCSCDLYHSPEDDKDASIETAAIQVEISGRSRTNVI